MTPFAYHAPQSLPEALALLCRDGARPLAGGTDLIAQLREGRRAVAHVVDMKTIADLTAVERMSDGSWSIGAAATVGALGLNTAFAAEHAGLLAAARLIGSLQIQNRASLGGNLCNAAPSADAVPMLHCLGARAEIHGPEGVRHVPTSEIGIAPGKTSLANGEMLVSIHLPAGSPRSAARYLRFTPRREMDIAVAGSAAYLAFDASGRVETARIVLASVAPTALPVPAAAAMLVGEAPSPALFRAAGEAAARDARPISDTRGSADYRRALISVLTRRALAAAASDVESAQR